MNASSSRRASLAAQVLRLFIVGRHDRYVLPGSGPDEVARLIEQAIEGANAVEDIGSMLKLIHVLETTRGSPALAEELAAILAASNGAKRIIHQHWSRANADRDYPPGLASLEKRRAPRIDDEAPESSVKLSTFLNKARRMA